MKIFPVVRINENNRAQVNDTVVKEFALTIELNGQEIVTLLCSPENNKAYV